MCNFHPLQTNIHPMNKCILLAISISFPVIILAQMPAGAIAKFPLDNTAIDISGNNYNGSLNATSATANRFLTSNTATAFTAGSSIGTLPLALVTAVSNDFSLGFWFNTTMTASNSSQWYGGNSLVDAEVCGGTTDWGTALVDGGKVCMGIGNPDITIKSPAAGYNDGNWHFVTVSRNKASGIIILYMEGIQVASSSGTNTGSLTAPANIRLGSNPCVPTCVYTGSVDDIIFYNRVLSTTEVSDMYTAMIGGVLPLHWISFTGELQGNLARLQWQVEAAVNNDHFEIEHSTDGIHFSKKGSVHDGVTTTVAGRALYTFLDNGVAKGVHFYRIKQVDTDGRFTLSKTIQLKSGHIPGVFLRSNPVGDELVLENNDQAAILRLQVADIPGRILIDRKLQTTDPVIRTVATKLKPGYYLLKITGINGEMTIPWIKE